MVAQIPDCHVVPVGPDDKGQCLFENGCRYLAGNPMEVDIPKEWTVWVDVVTPVMENLTIRGNVKFRRGMGRELGIHVHNILIKGGRLEIGTGHTVFFGSRPDDLQLLTTQLCT